MIFDSARDDKCDRRFEMVLGSYSPIDYLIHTVLHIDIPVKDGHLCDLSIPNKVKLINQLLRMIRLLITYGIISCDQEIYKGYKYHKTHFCYQLIPIAKKTKSFPTSCL